LEISRNLFISYPNNQNLETMDQIKLSPGTEFISLGNGQTVRNWFESNSNDTDPNYENFETEKSVAFDVGDLKKLLAQNPQELVLSKHKLGPRHDNKKTLAIVGVDSQNVWKTGGDFSVLVGTHFNFPTSAKSFPLNFSNLKKPNATRNGYNINGNWFAPDTVANPTGTFKTQMDNFQKTPANNNLFRSIRFDAAFIKGLTRLSGADKVAFLSGFVSFTMKEKYMSGPFELAINSSIPIEVLIAFAVDDHDKVLGDPVTQQAPWPLYWK
jgi:hypothetical protein